MVETNKDNSARHVLLTNDDGFDAPGLAAMYAALEGLARVDVIAPARPASSGGHAVTDHGCVQVERRRVEPFGPIHIVHGTPADCVRLGLVELMNPLPDWVIAGINRGGNLGVDVYYSGTVAAAREAAILGVPAIAVSQFVRRDVTLDWPRATEWTRRVLERLFELPINERPPIWNVNLPALTANKQPLSTRVAPTAVAPLQVCYAKKTESKADGCATYEFAGEYGRRPAPPGTDVALTFEGHITISPLALDTTCERWVGRTI